ncbi:MAG: Hpt domain-containing protein [Pseudomonadota bacterium]|nr:Hpt domain-containing protein [Pseudomonadota bacterium]
MNEVIDKRAAMCERINELAVRFLQRCSQDMVLLRALVIRLHGGDNSAFKELEYLAHRVSGTGATLGFASLSLSAGAIERLAEAQSTVLLSECMVELEQEIERLAGRT